MRRCGTSVGLVKQFEGLEPMLYVHLCGIELCVLDHTDV